MQEEEINKYIRLWAELVDIGEICALQTIKNIQSSSNALNVFKKALEEQSESHYRGVIEILNKLSKSK